MCSEYFTFIGICCDIVGALIIFAGVFTNRDKAAEVATMRISHNNPSENVDQPAAQNLLFQSKTALVGTLLLVVGFLLQGIGAWPF